MTVPDVKTIIGVSSVYHTPIRPERGAFVYNLFRTWRAMGIEVPVVAPQSVLRNLHEYFYLRRSPNSRPEDPVLINPGYASISSRLLPFHDYGEKLSNWQMALATARGLRQLDITPSFVYTHFLNTAWATQPYCLNRNFDHIIGLGESDFSAAEKVFTRAVVLETLKRATGVVTVSMDIREFLLDRAPELEPKLTYIPNGIDESKFKPLDRDECRKKLGINPDAFIIAFTGFFCARKGHDRVLGAIQSIPNTYGMFFGTGPNPPSGERVLFAGTVMHNDLPTWLNAADAFVLPSRLEGMSNAILEALGCGLPLVVSDRSFNHNFLTESCSLFVDPDSISQMARAIDLLRKDPELRARMSKDAAAHSAKFTIGSRASRIIDFWRSRHQ